ncbi:MAG: hypothetical protein ACFFDO_01470 [Candidatus Thorarchaeota archaeon]
MLSKQRKIILIRIIYWLGIILDGLNVVEMMLFMLYGFTFALGYSDSSDGARYVAVLGTGLMLGWTILLLWGERKPIERKDLLLLTVFPVITSFMLFEFILYFLGNNMISLFNILFFLCFQVTISIIFILGYKIANDIEKQLEN